MKFYIMMILHPRKTYACLREFAQGSCWNDSNTSTASSDFLHAFSEAPRPTWIDQ